VSLAAGVNFLPWTGPTIRSAAVLHLSATDIFRPLVPLQAIGLVFVFGAAWWLGRREERRLGLAGAGSGPTALALAPAPRTPEQERLRRPGLFWLNLALTIAIMAVMIWGIADPVVMFMIGTVLALAINYPKVAEQRARIDAHAKAALMMAGILLAAGAFTGIMTGSGMLKAMATAAVAHVPAAMASHIPVLLGFVSMPLSLVFDPDSYYFGIMPVIAEVVKGLGGDPIHVAQASLLGQMTTGFPVSPLTPATFLVVGLTGIELGEHQRFSIPWLFAATVVMTIAGVLLGILPW
jgi:CitMHS family citrate-Mg2+:H+ or citrate-Ca2+:H+ symporter